MAKITGAKSVPERKAASGGALDRIRTITMPQTEANRPIVAKARGRNIIASRVAATVIVDAIATQAIIAPQYDSKISEPIPAMSPTLSPTLSAITPGLRGSSSGMPASIFPTKSAPTSALLVKMPPPTRENKATTDAPMPKPWMACAVPGSPPKYQ